MFLRKVFSQFFIAKFNLVVITIATFTRAIQRKTITTRGRNLNICRKRVHFECYLGQGVRVSFCLRSLATQKGLVKTRNVASERLVNSDKLSKNFSFRKIDRQLGFRSHNVRIASWFAFVGHCNYIEKFTASGKKMTKLKQKTKTVLNLNSVRDE